MKDAPIPRKEEIDQRKVEGVVDRLTDDYHRQSGYLTKEQVERILYKKNLSGVECAYVWDALENVGIFVNADGNINEENAVLSEESLANSTALVAAPSAPSHLLKTSNTSIPHREEQITLGRRYAIARRVLERHTGEEIDVDPYLKRSVAEGLKARARMITGNIPLVVNIAKDWIWAGLDSDDLVQEGILGLMTAVKKWDPERGFAFSTYATWWVRQSITRAIADKSQMIRYPVHVVEAQRKLRRATKYLKRINRGAEPTLAALANELTWEPEKVAFHQGLAEIANVLSLDEPVKDDNNASVLDIIPGHERTPEQIVEAEDTKAKLRSLMRALPERKCTILERRFGFDDGRSQTLEEIGQWYGLTRERIRQLQREAQTMLGQMAELKSLWE